MKTKKTLVVAGLIAAMSLGSIGIADASQKNVHANHKVVSVTQVDPDVAVLAQLVTAGTITQAQSTLILAALQAAHPAPPEMGGGMMGEKEDGFNLRGNINVITTTLGITVAQLQTALVAGQSLATIAGVKTAALITALVAAETVEINARVTSGDLTQAQATTLIAGLTATVTAIVNSPLPVGGFGHEGHEKHGHGHGMGNGFMGGMMGGMGSQSDEHGENPNN